MSDNFHFDLCGVPLDLSLLVACRGYTKDFRGNPWGRKAIGWSVEPCDAKGTEAVWGANRSSKRLVLYWTKHDSMTPFASPLGHEELVPMVKAWLAEADYGKEPGHDGENSKGWRVYNEGWTHVADRHQAFVAIEPVWMLHGK